MRDVLGQELVPLAMLAFHIPSQRLGRLDATFEEGNDAHQKADQLSTKSGLSVLNGRTKPLTVV